MLEHNRQAKHWKMDEARWMVFEEVEGKNKETFRIYTLDEFIAAITQTSRKKMLDLGYLDLRFIWSL